MRGLASFGVGLAVIVVVLGAFTRLVDAGLGCPDWPGCYGHLMWPDTESEIATAEQAFPDAPVDLDKTWPEMVHRYFAGSLLLLVLGMNWLALRQSRNASGSAPAGAENITRLVQILLVLIVCQGAFGAWTVTLKLWPQVVTAHLLGGFATLAMLWTIVLRSGGLVTLTLSGQHRQEIATLANFSLAAVIAQVALGGWVSSNYAALACADFPTCYGVYVPEMNFARGFDVFQALGPNYLGGLLDSESRVAIHWTHRMGAMVVFAVVGSLGVALVRRNLLLGVCVLGVLALQIVLGILNVVWALPLYIATLHNACGALLLLGVVTVNFAPEKPA